MPQRNLAVFPETPKSVVVLGSTGSVGRSTVDLLLAYPDKFRVKALTAGRNVALLAEQARALSAEYAVIADAALYNDLKKALEGSSVKAMAGDKAVAEVAAFPSDWVMAAIVGTAGLRPTLAALAQGCTVALANKESLVCAGRFMMEAAKKSKAQLLPVDSEHNAVFQVLKPDGLRRIILTASGGPFLNLQRHELASITPEQAIRHPNWSMGAKISVDSATMVNKSLEIIEASYLFNLKSEEIDVVIHPQSIIHAMVEYIDGSILAQMGAPDMRTPILHTLAWPKRLKTSGNGLDLNNNINFSLQPVDVNRFPSISIARQVLRQGGTAPIVFNAANEIAVAAFLDKRLPFLAIEQVIDRALQEFSGTAPESLEDVLAADEQARALAGKLVAALQ